LRDVGSAKKRHEKPSVFDRVDLWLSSGKEVEGLWVGTTDERQPTTMRRVEDALSLIKQHSPLHFSRVVRNLKRVWVRLVPYSGANGCYYRSLDACVLDPRFLALETTTLEEIASAIVHETTHARLERWGISYEETKRSRIEAICRRRELNFLRGLPNGETYREQLHQALASPVDDHGYFSDAGFQQRTFEGNIESLRYLGTPAWLIRLLLKWLALRRRFRRFVKALPPT